VPAGAADYCHRLWLEYKFALRITRHRSTKLGDYRYSPEKGHQISVNNSLNLYAFLITYIHEVAHLVTFSRYKRKVKPHGPEWKKSFQTLMAPVANSAIFPEELLLPLQQYMASPKASSCSDPKLMAAIRTFDVRSEGQVLLKLQTGEKFRLSGRVFVKGTIRRTRVVCEEPATRKKYLVPSQAVVEKIDI
jgi:predicted SprT family Zn-dependent metalloprotease